MYGEFLGFWDLETTLQAGVPITDGAGLPGDPAAAPAVRVYDGVVCLATGNLAPLDTGPVEDATNQTPVTVFSANHNLQTGARVTVTGVTGNPAANGTWQVTRAGNGAFSLDGSAGNGDWLAGGSWHLTGLYQISVPLTESGGFAHGRTYQAHVTYRLAGVTYTRMFSFTVL